MCCILGVVLFPSAFAHYPTLCFCFKTDYINNARRSNSFSKRLVEREGWKWSYTEFWCKQGTVDAALRIFCNKYVKHDNQGLPQLIQHARGQRHKGLVKDIAIGNQTTIQKNLNNGNVTCESAKAAITKAELIWDMKSVSLHFSYSASVQISAQCNVPRKDTFQFYNELFRAIIAYIWWNRTLF